MTFLQTLANTGLHFAHSPSERRSILLSNLVSVTLFGLGGTLSIAYYLYYGWSFVTIAIPVISFLCLSTIVLNKYNFSLISRVWLTLFIPVSAMALSIYAKRLYYASQEELDYFTFRFIILGSCSFPAIFFSFKRRNYLILTSLAGLLILLLHDPLHAYFGVPYKNHILKETSYAFTNVVIFITYGLLMAGIIFLKWISEQSEERAEKLIHELNQSNEKLESHYQEITAQSDNLNLSQRKLQEAYKVIEDQKNLLVKQNKSLSSELLEINKDLSDTNSELIKYNNELRQFSYTVSHNLRGPVASLMGLIALIDKRDMDTDNVEIIDHIKTSVERLDTVIKDLSKIIDIRHDIFNIRQKISLQTEVNEIIHILKRDIDAHKVSINTDFSECPQLYSVRPMVHSILYNLISNALKYRTVERRPEITITSKLAEHYIIEITDNGLGIDLIKHKDNLFKLYKRFHTHTEGKGLGLYLVKLQAEALGGRVEVESEINRYTKFRIYLGKPENVDQQILFEEAYAKIFFDASINSIGTIWSGPVSSEQYRNAFIKCLEFVKVYNTPGYVADLTNQGNISKEDQLWMFTYIMPEAALHGLKRIAAVKPEKASPHTEEYLRNINMNLVKLGIRQEYFLTMNDAFAWVESEIQKLTR